MHLIIFLFLIALAAGAGDNKTREWLTWGGDAERSGWNRGETAISRRNAANLELKWKLQVDPGVPVDIHSGAAMLTAPLIVENVKTARGNKTLVFTLAASNTLAAIDADSGQMVWHRKFINKTEPPRPANWICTNTSTATPVIDRQAGIVYLLSADGVLHGVNLKDGEDRLPPTDFVPPFSRNWSLNLVDGVLYTTVGRGCGAAASQTETVASHMVAMDLRDPKRPIRRMMTSDGKPSGVWGRGGLAWGPKGIYAQTADGTFEPEAGKWGNTILALDPKTLEVRDYFVPPNLEVLNSKDLDFGSASPLTFSYKNWQIVLAGGKDGMIYLLDAASMGGKDHQTPLFARKLGNDADNYASQGIWGAMATALDPKGERWVYIPMWGPPSKEASGLKQTHGEAPTGSIMALRLAVENGKPVLIPEWMSRDLAVPEPPVVANGVVFAVSTGENTQQRTTAPLPPGQSDVLSRSPKKARKSSGPRVRILTAQERNENTTHVTLYALDAFTGRELYSSRDLVDDWTHLSSVTVGAGKVYLTTRKSLIFAFGPKR